MRERKCIPACAAALACVLMSYGPVAAAEKSQPEETVIFPEQEAVLSPFEIPKLKNEALSGSADAAHRLATYYGMILLDNTQRVFWTRIRVENGDRNARYDLGAFLAVEPDADSQTRARYWLNAVIKDSPPALAEDAKSILTDMDEADERARKANH